MRLLGRVERRVVRGGDKVGREGDTEKDISIEEIRGAIGKLRDGKAVGIDEIPNEAWKYGEERIEEWLWGFCKKVWEGEGWPEKWKERVIVPIIKKGDGEVVEDYRGVTLMATAYKVYAAVLAERLG